MNITLRHSLLWLLAPVLAFGQGSQLPKYLVGNLPSAASQPKYTVQVIDGANDQDCVTGGGSKNVLCKSTGSAWVPVSPYQTLTTTGTSGAATLNLGVLNIPVYTAGGFIPLITPPVAGQYCIVYPTTWAGSVSQPTISSVVADNTSGVITQSPKSAFPPSISSITWSNPVICPEASGGTIGSIYSFAISGRVGSSGSMGITGNGNLSPVAPSASTPWPAQQFTVLTGLNAGTLPGATIFASASNSGSSPETNILNIQLVGWLVYYTGGTAPATQTAINIAAPLTYNTANNTLGVDQTFPAYTFGALPLSLIPATPAPLGYRFLVSDCTTTSGVCTGGGANREWVDWDGANFNIVATGGSGITALTGDVTAAGSGSVPATLANTAVTPGSYTNSNITVDSKGRLTSAANGSAGGSGLSGQTTTCLPKAATATTSTSSSAVCDSGTVITSTEPLSIAPGGGQGGTFDATEGTAPSGASGHDVLYADSAAHCFKQSLNGGSFSCLGAAAGTVTTSGSPASGDIAAFSSSTAITTATSTQINTLIKTLTGCNTAGFFYSPQGADCVAASGSGTVSGQASGVIPLGTSATAISNQSHLDDGNSTAATITSTEPIAVSVTGASQESFTYNATPIVPGSGTTAVIGASSAGLFTVSEAGGSVVQGCTAGNTACNKLSGMTASQVAIAATASTVTSSKAIQGTDTNLLSSGIVSGTGATLCTSANGGATTSGCSAGASPWTNITGSVTSSCNGTACSVTSGALVIAGTTTTTVTLSSIPAHNRMQIVWWGAGSADGFVWLQPNSDITAAHYAFNGSYQQAAVNPQSNWGVSSANGLDTGGIATGISQSVFEIPFYADTSFPKAITGHNSAFDSATSNANNFDVVVGGYWNQTTAITSMLFTISTGHFVAGTKFMILVQD